MSCAVVEATRGALDLQPDCFLATARERRLARVVRAVLHPDEHNQPADLQVVVRKGAE